EAEMDERAVGDRVDRAQPLQGGLRLRAGAGLALEQPRALLLGLLPGGDVLGHSREPIRLSRGVPDAEGAVVYPAHGSVRAEDAVGRLLLAPVEVRVEGTAD